jgi:hypothetical protein
MKMGHYKKEVKDYMQCDLNRVALQSQLSQVSPVFPKLSFLFGENSIVQYSERIKAHRLPPQMNLKSALWAEFKKAISFVHQKGYVHGDILLKNILYDGERLILLDHELRLKEGRVLRFTYPWVALSDLHRGEITIDTDQICLKATELRLFDNAQYLEFRKECMDQLRIYKLVRSKEV